jgi:hypothetical protein
MTEKVKFTKLPRDAWKPGALWENKDQSKGKLIAVILAPDRPSNKKVHMEYVNGMHTPWHRLGHVVRGTYSHRHMQKYFNFTGTFKDIATLKEKNDER